MNASSQTLQSQGSPILLLAHLLTAHPDLPAATYHVDNIVPDHLYISLHDGDFGRFEEWRLLLGLGVPVTHIFGESTWVDVEGVVQDVPVRLTGHGTAAEVAAYVASNTAVAA
ncbi:hypothetical protein ACIBKZ_22395 [Streptomyces sp. NPDC050421]|uniref:hypothetical protein n=1 Tax=Streptomyces sp. NPDC050421 TaxID=3365613 RepID=UPI0037B2E9F1